MTTTKENCYLDPGSVMVKTTKDLPCAHQELVLSQQSSQKVCKRNNQALITFDNTTDTKINFQLYTLIVQKQTIQCKLN